MSYPYIPFEGQQLNQEESQRKSKEFYAFMNRRRSVRTFSDRPVSKGTIENLIMTASSAPSGAHKQPWTFCAVSNPVIRKKIRDAAESEEKLNYGGRMSESWLRDLAHLGTDWNKPFLEVAPWLIVVFKKPYDLASDGTRLKNYYVNESVGLAAGFLLTAIHEAGLVSLTHTPSPMNFLERILDRPDNERAFLLIPVGYAADDATVPDIKRRPLEEVAKFYS
ncbi:MAG: nitroreductase family protein [Saprospiraceae bacterium]|nr:nitroreductase family protein [Saprospiraceae bacterium]